MQAITSSVSQQIGQHIWTCRGTATSFTSQCQEIIGECSEEVGLRKQLTWTVRFRSDKELKENTLLAGQGQNMMRFPGTIKQIQSKVYIFSLEQQKILYAINLLPKAVTYLF